MIHLANARLAGRSETSVLLQDGTIAGFCAPAPAGAAVVDLDHRLVLPALIDAHVHLDKTLLGLRWQPHRAENTTRGRIEGEKNLRRTLQPPVETCGAELLRAALSSGTTAVRSHVDIDDVTGLRNVEAVLRLREAWSPFVEHRGRGIPAERPQALPGRRRPARRGAADGMRSGRRARPDRHR